MFLSGYWKASIQKWNDERSKKISAHTLNFFVLKGFQNSVVGSALNWKWITQHFLNLWQVAWVLFYKEHFLCRLCHLERGDITALIHDPEISATAKCYCQFLWIWKHIQHALSDLRWLSVCFQSQFKVPVFIFRVLRSLGVCVHYTQSRSSLEIPWFELPHHSWKATSDGAKLEMGP